MTGHGPVPGPGLLLLIRAAVTGYKENLSGGTAKLSADGTPQLEGTFPATTERSQIIRETSPHGGTPQRRL